MGMPAFSYRRILVTFAAYERHIGFYPTPSAVRAFANDLSKFATASASIQFPLDKPLPLPLIRKITASRSKKVSRRTRNGEPDGTYNLDLITVRSRLPDVSLQTIFLALGA